MNSLTYRQIVEVPPKMVMEIALGVREPADVAEDYGFSAAQWGELKLLPSFVKQIEDKKSELKQSGITPIDFGVGDPKEPTPEIVRNAIKK